MSTELDQKIRDLRGLLSIHFNIAEAVLLLDLNNPDHVDRLRKASKDAIESQSKIRELLRQI
jgi:hypothetical protein